MGAVEGRLEYDIQGSGQAASIIVTGTPRGGSGPQTVRGTVKDWRTFTKNKEGKQVENAWDKIPEDMLVYRGTRQWARRYAPEALLGVYTPDEVEPVADVRVIATVQQGDSTPGGYRHLDMVSMRVSHCKDAAIIECAMKDVDTFDLNAAISALAARQLGAVPAGWRLVPELASEGQLRAALDTGVYHDGEDSARAVLADEYRTMVAAAPPAQGDHPYQRVSGLEGIGDAADYLTRHPGDAHAKRHLSERIDGAAPGVDRG